MTVALTGASGMVGSAVLAELTQAGRKVRLLSYGEVAAGGVEATRLPSAGADLAAFRQALAGADCVVHCAALNNDEGASSAALFEANAVLAGKLAQAAEAVVPGRFVHLSSIRAVAGAERRALVGEATPPAPTCAYGASKLAGEEAVRQAYGKDRPGRLVILRPAPIYGLGMRGGLRTLLRLADSPWPLPFAALAMPRSLLSLEGAVRAVLLALTRERLARIDYVASDADAVSIADIVAAFRKGLSRPRRLFAVPPFLFAQAARLAGRQAAWARISGGQVCDPSALAALGWAAETDTRAALAALARRLARPN